MGFLEWATSPWGQRVPIHIAWFLIWVAAIAGLLFLMVHATYVRYFAKPRNLPVASHLSSPHAFRNASPGIRSPRACSTGSWPPPCSRCCSPRSFRKSASSSIG